MKPLFTLATVVAYALSIAGCGEAPSPNPTAGGAAKSKEHPHDHAAHTHAEHGPHGGDLIELGKEDYHAELIHDEGTGKITIYILDRDAKNAVPITATEVTINVKHDGQGEQFKVAAVPQDGDGEGKSSRFVSDDKELSEDIEHEARLIVEINGKSFTGDIKHGHAHEGHKHEKK